MFDGRKVVAFAFLHIYIYAAYENIIYIEYE